MRITMKRICAVILGLMMVLSISIAVSGPTHVAYADEGSQEMYRMYNPNSGEHFYTANSYERDNLKSLGWHYEGVGWVAPVKSSVPVYRLYNSNAGDHHYTMNSYERDMLVSKGWRYEGIGWYSADTTNEFPLYRQYNPNAKAGAHNYTLNSNERDALVRAGWHDEGLAWYALGLGGPAQSQPSTSSTPSQPSEPATVPGAISPGAYCKKIQKGQYGRSKDGDLYQCSYHPGNKIPHWYPVQ